MSIFEAGMLLCFGLAWPVNIYKSCKTRSTGGKSAMFLFIVFFGYISGILHKLIYSRDIVLVLYIVNAVMVSIDMCLFFRNRRYEKSKQL